MNQFDTYKKSLEDILVNIDFIYSGDIISSIEKKFHDKLNHSSISAKFARDVLVEIYNYSVTSMFEKSEEIIVHRNSFKNPYELIDMIPISPKILFYSVNTNLNLNLSSNIIEPDGKGHLPEYFNRRFKIDPHGRDISAYFCPLIEDDVDDFHFYISDKPIQSMVWSLQNMEYNIVKGFSSNEHIIKIPFYSCDYKSYRIRVVNTQKLREDKINSILDENN